MTAEEKLRIISEIVLTAFKNTPRAANPDTPYFGIFMAIYAILTLDAEENK